MLTAPGHRGGTEPTPPPPAAPRHPMAPTSPFCCPKNAPWDSRHPIRSATRPVARATGGTAPNWGEVLPKQPWGGWGGVGAAGRRRARQHSRGARRVLHAASPAFGLSRSSCRAGCTGCRAAGHSWGCTHAAPQGGELHGGGGGERLTASQAAGVRQEGDAEEGGAGRGKPPRLTLAVDDALHHLLQPHHVDELAVGCAGQEVQQRRGRFGGWDLQQGFLQLFAQGQLGGCLRVGGVAQRAGAGERGGNPVDGARLDVRGKVHVDG